MSDLHNVRWLENAYDDFLEAVSEKNINLARAVIDKVANYGFAREAVTMCQELKEFKLSLV